MLRVNMAIGGSLNTVLHLPAIAHELGRTLRWDAFDRISRETPHLCSIEPSGPATLAELESAGKGLGEGIRNFKDSVRTEDKTATGESEKGSAKDANDA